MALSGNFKHDFGDHDFCKEGEEVDDQDNMVHLPSWKTKSLSPEAAGVLLGIAAVYLIYGEYANLMCTALTSLPAAIFTYNVLISKDTTKKGYHATLFYWTVYGGMALMDQFLGQLQGYYLAKAVFLSGFFLHALKLNPKSVPVFMKDAQAVSTEVLSSIMSVYDSEGFEVNTERSLFDPRTPTPTAFSDDSVYMLNYTPNRLVAGEEEMTSGSVSTANSIFYSPDMDSTQTVGTSVTGNTASTTKCQRRGAQTSVVQLVSPVNEDLHVYPPSAKILIKDEEHTTITFINTADGPIVFSLRTNIDEYLIAAPTSGILEVGQKTDIRLGNKKIGHEFGSSMIGKLAFDYAITRTEPVSIKKRITFSVYQSA